MNNRERTVSRDLTVTQIPLGDRTLLQAGTRVRIHQSLGGHYTVMADHGLFRIDGSDADAIGEQATATDAAGPASAPSPTTPSDPEAIWEQLRQVYDPEIPVNIVDLGLVYSMDVEPALDGGSKVYVAMTLTSPGCGMGPAIAEDARRRVLSVPGVVEADVRLVWDPAWTSAMVSEEGKMKLGLI